MNCMKVSKKIQKSEQKIYADPGNDMTIAVSEQLPPKKIASWIIAPSLENCPLDDCSGKIIPKVVAP